MEIILYKTETCPRCKILKQKLDSLGIKYQECYDQNFMINKGINKVPILEVNGHMMQYYEANTWINERKYK